MSQRRFELGAIPGVLRGFEVVQHTPPREFETLDLLLASYIGLGLGRERSQPPAFLGQLLLRLDVLTFPTASHKLTIHYGLLRGASTA